MKQISSDSPTDLKEKRATIWMSSSQMEGEPLMKCLLFLEAWKK